MPAVRPVVAALLLTVLVAGCTARTELPRNSDHPHAGPYRIKVGDYLGVRFYKTPELNVEVPVRSDGKISLEILGDVDAAGLEPTELSRLLSERYASELTNPRVTVIVLAFGGQIFVGGEVKNPSAVPFATGMTVLQAIDGAGGFLDTAKPDSVVLIRHADGAYQAHELNLKKALSGKDLSVNVALQPSDIVHVPRSRIANMNLLVDQYIRRNLPINPSVGAAAF
jgi:protein involved in polysaccharide export with SLBB domain